MKDIFLEMFNYMRMRFMLLFISILFGAVGLMAQVNYLRTWTATAPEPNPNTLITRPLSDVKQVTQYFDGLGRPIQTVARQGSLETSSGNNVDLVSMVGYDAFGRNNMNYLPYTASNNDGSYKTDAFTAQPAFYNGTSPIVGQGENGANAHTQINFEASPLNRPVLTMAPGNSWVGNGTGKGVQSGYWVNTSTDDVKMWSVVNSSTTGTFGTYTMTGAYPAGTLYKNITTDENGNQVVEFKDIDGKVILKKVQPVSGTTDYGSGSGYNNWLCTYYIYDILNNLRCVIQPAGVQTLTGNSWSLSATLLSEQCFRYEYDARNRLIMKQVPGAGTVYMVYDKVDRLVMTQDANLRNLTTPQWMVTVYDNLNRPIQTGLLNGTAGDFGTNLTAADSSISFPSTTSGFEVLTITHYDDYTSLPTNNPAGLSSTFQSTWNSQFSATSTSYPYPVMPAKNTNSSILYKGMVTWTQVKVINSGSPGTYLTSVNIYDDKGRVVQTQSQNYSGGINVTTTQYNWAGQQLVVVQSQAKSGTNAQTTVTVSRMSYDNLNRLASTTKQVQNTLINNNALTSANSISALQYDVLGQLNTKNLGNTKSGINYTSTPLETQVFDYNIRGWLLGVNRLFVKNTSNNSYTNSGETFTTPSCYCAGNFFGFELGYDKAPTVGGSAWTSTVQLNGNITGTIWKSVHDGEIRKYDFSYDAANRLTAANFTQYTGGSFNQNAGINYNVNIPDYDANGNIMHMNQYGLLPSNTSTIIDSLTYNYISGTNRLQSVTDLANGNTPAPGTKDANGVPTYMGDFHYNTGGTTATYSYDGNGNLTSDGNKNTSNIAYNYLNLPQTINISGNRTISYTYDAAGNKLQKQTNDNGLVTTITYIGGIVYQNDVLQFIAHEEGRIRVNSSNNGYIFDYFLKDHLGNTRMTITDDNTAATPIIDATSYYPFGLVMSGISSQAAGKLENKYKFNAGTELNSDFNINIYETKFRGYDAQIGRFRQIDAFSDAYDFVSPYQFAFNNPNIYNDPTGLLTEGELSGIINDLSSHGGGSWAATSGTSYYQSDAVAFQAGASYMNQFDLWGKNGSANSFADAQNSYKGEDQTVKGLLNDIIVKGYIKKGMWNTTSVTYPTGYGGSDDDLDNTNKGLGTFCVGWGAKQELLDYTVRSYNGLTRSAFNNLNKAQRGVAEMAAMGVEGAKYLKMVKKVGFVGLVVSTGISVYTAGKYYSNHSLIDHPGVAGKTTLDIAMGVVGFLGPIGFAVSATYFIVDASTGGLGGWGDPNKN